MNIDTQNVLELILGDAVLEMQHRKRINEDVLERIVLVYLSFFSGKNFLEYDSLNSYEKNIFCRIIAKGIASMYVDDEYIFEDNKHHKSKMIYELMLLLCYLTNLNYSTIKKLMIRDIKIYIRVGWDWQFL